MNSHDGVQMKLMCFCSISSMALLTVISGPSTTTKSKPYRKKYVITQYAMGKLWDSVLIKVVKVVVSERFTV